MAATALGSEVEGKQAREAREAREASSDPGDGERASGRTPSTAAGRQHPSVDVSVLGKSSTTAASASKLVDFRGSYDGICRGVPVARVLARGGSLLAAAKGSSETLSLSSPVSHLYAFVSHNWATPRARKYLTLVLHFNFDFAFATSSSLLILLGVANFLGWLPTVTDVAWEQPVGILCRLLYIPLFFVCLVLRYEIAWRFGFASPMVFLDKACIHQTDPDKMSVGIRKLGAFLNVSNRMVAVYTDLYLTKVWTVYELACFLATHRAEQLDVAHVQESLFFVGGTTVAFFFGVFSIILGLKSQTEVFLSTALLLALAVYGAQLLLRSGARAQQETLRRLASFSVRSCTCAVESDRPLVYENIAVLMVAKGWASPDAELGEALDAFDALVRERLPNAFRRGAGFCHKKVLMISSAFALTFTLDHITGITFGVPTRVVVAYALPGFIACVFIVPLVFALGSRGVKLTVHFTGWRAQCMGLLLSLVLIVLSFFFYMLVNMWAEAAVESDVALAALTTATGICTLNHLVRLYSADIFRTRRDVEQRISCSDSEVLDKASEAPQPPREALGEQELQEGGGAANFAPDVVFPAAAAGCMV